MIWINFTRYIWDILKFRRQCYIISTMHFVSPDFGQMWITFLYQYFVLIDKYKMITKYFRKRRLQDFYCFTSIRLSTLKSQYRNPLLRYVLDLSKVIPLYLLHYSTLLHWDYHWVKKRYRAVNWLQDYDTHETNDNKETTNDRIVSRVKFNRWEASVSVYLVINCIHIVSLNQQECKGDCSCMLVGTNLLSAISSTKPCHYMFH